MRTIAAIRVTIGVLACICAMTVMTACDKGGDGHGIPAVVTAKDTLSRDETYDAMFNLIVSGVYRDPDSRTTLKAIGDLCDEICKLPKEDALALLDRFVFKAINAKVPYEDYRLREVWFEQLFDVVYVAFTDAQSLQKESFEHWDVLFRFFAKCNCEITSVQESLPSTDSSCWKQSDLDKGRYLYGIKEKYKVWIHVIRDIYFAKLNDGLTGEQKADILRRFDELERYTLAPANFQGRNK